MPAIKPISDLRNYTQVLKEVDSVGRVYLTRNGQEHTPSCPLKSWMNWIGSKQQA